MRWALTAMYPVEKKPIPLVSISLDRIEGASVGLSGIAGFLSLEKEALGVTIRLSGVLPEASALRKVADTAITVHITNIRKHTTGKTAVVRSEREGAEWILTLEDDGESKAGEIIETGGLKNLRTQVEDLGGRMEVRGDPRFRLVIRLPEGGGAT